MQETTILITGGLGFIGSNFVDDLIETKPDQNLLILDKKTYAADLKALDRWKQNTQVSFVKGDICDAILLEKLFQKNNIQGIIHFAAESHVDNSISGPKDFVETNIMGTFRASRSFTKKLVRQ